MDSSELLLFITKECQNTIDTIDKIKVITSGPLFSLEYTPTQIAEMNAQRATLQGILTIIEENKDAKL